MGEEKIKGLVYRGLWAALVVGGAVLFFRFGLSIVLPFGLAYFLAVPVRPLCLKLGRGTDMGKKVWAVVLIAAGVGILGTALWFVINSLWREVAQAVESMGDSVGEDSPLSQLLDGITRLVSNIKEKAAIEIGEPEKLFSEAISTVSRKAADLVGRFIGYAPSAIFFVCVFILSLYYFFCDMEKLKGDIKAFLPVSCVSALGMWIGVALSALKRFAKAYLLLLLITYVMLSVGFFIIGVEYPLLFALLTSLVDILPILGVGTVLCPWAAVLFLTGDTAGGISMLVLFLVLYGVRQVIEPRLVGNAAGVHPLIALFSVYIGFKISGVSGMIIAPVVLNAVCVFLEEKRKKTCT